MGKGKLAKFADMAANPLVVECPYWQLQKDGFDLKGRWGSDFFHNQNPIVLELGCGRGEYTVGLAHVYSDHNFIGVDIKGSRMWHGAQQAQAEGLTNVAFLRTNIEFIHEMFAPDEVSELWLTFSDPQMKKPTKRLTSTYFMERYRRFLIDRGVIHLKSDSNFMATYTRLMAEANGFPIETFTDDLYANHEFEISPLTTIRTYYEQMWIERGLNIKYMKFLLPHEGPLEESEQEIPLDEYRSYHRNKRSTKETAK